MTGRIRYTLRARERILDLGRQTRIMGILNVTPDSFSGDGLLSKNDFVAAVLRKACLMGKQGADILDIGGESTRPGSGAVTALEECRRVIPVIEAIVASGLDVMISVDTSKAPVARDALKAGAHVINVVRAYSVSAGLLNSVRRYEAGIVLMHMRGTPRTMTSLTQYRHLAPDVLAELRLAVDKALTAGVERSGIIVDPGIGFAKTREQNFQLIRQLRMFGRLGFPVLLGPSRKSFIGSVLGAAPDARLYGTVAAVVAGVINGAHIVRVHDVAEIRQASQITDALLSGGS